MRKNCTTPEKILLFCLAWSVFAGPALAADKLTRISDNVYAYVDTKQSSKDNSFGANAGIIIGRDGIAVIDTLVSAKEAKRFIKAIKGVSRKPIKYVINTHFHLDHVFGNAEFVKLGAVVIGQENCTQAMARTAETTLKNSGQYGLTPQDMKGTTIAYPVLSYTDRLTIDLGGQIVELRHARPSHTDGDTLVFLPDKKVLFAGDILFTDYHPFLAEGNIEEWRGELDGLQAMDVEVIIPGHGPLSGKKDLAEMRQYLLQFDQQAKALATQGGDPQALAAEMLKTLPPRAESAWLVNANLKMRYLTK
ncbi:MAG: MBL fold metallo-hydrolase [Desulfobulbaceae bacterium]|nr:MBL fold metallo-hydrolase [Desulfobulbaceae bacterium]HIJ90129.1 MBL fold metallo-hydrolase [Deltaproteobacteria bacterium]